MITSQEKYRLCRYVGRIVGGEAPGEGWEQFHGKLLESPELRQNYYQLMALTVELSWRQSKGQSLDYLLTSLGGQPAVAKAPVKSHRYTLSAKLLALAASLLLVVYFAGLVGLLGLARWQQLVGRSAEVDNAYPKTFFAEIQSSENAIIDGELGPKLLGDRLAAESLRVNRGIAEFVFASGVRVAVEGPAEFTATGTNSGKLTRGRLLALVPEGAEGFAVETPHAKIVDLGTEFGVDVDAAGEAQIAVITGKVAVHRMGLSSSQAGEKPTALVAGNAWRASGTHFQTVAYNSVPFQSLRQQLGTEEVATAPTEREVVLPQIDLAADKDWESHWNAAEVWADGQVPSPLGHYHVGRGAGKRVRTPRGHHVDPFAGGILSIHPGGDLTLKHTGKAILRELRLEGGGIFVWDQLRHDSRLALDCRMQVLANSRFVLNGCRLLVVAALGGTGDVTLVGPGSVELQTDSRHFTGNWRVRDAILRANTLGGLGTGNVALVGKSRLIVGYEWGNPQAEVSLADESQLEFNRNITLKAVTLAGQPMPPGSYTHAQLQQQFPVRFAGDKGMLTVISASSTSLIKE